MNFHYPVFLDVGGKRCVVTGEGYEIPAKVRALVDCGADVVYVNPDAEASIEDLAAGGRLLWERRNFEPADLDGCFLVLTDQHANDQIFRLAEERNVLCNAVDDPEHCRFSFGSLYRRGDLAIAISTNGKAPAVAVRLKERLQREIGPEYAALVNMLGELRARVTGDFPDFGARRELWYRLVDSQALALLSAGEDQEARQLLLRLVAAAVEG